MRIKIVQTVIDKIRNKKKKPDPILVNNKELKNMGLGKRAFLLATGPSVKNQDLTMLENEDCFSISNFFLHKDINIIKPKLHFFAPYHEPLILENYIEWLRLADEKLPKETNIVLGLSNKDLAKQYNLFPNRKIYYLDLRTLDEVQTDIEKPVMGPQTGPIMILPVLDYMGYKTINLVGCDMNTLKNYKKKVENFYDVDPRKNATDNTCWSCIIDELKGILNAFMQFDKYNKFFISKNITLNNLSPDSWLDFVNMKNFYEEIKTK